MQLEWDDNVPDNLSENIVTTVSGLSENRRLSIANPLVSIQSLYSYINSQKQANRDIEQCYLILENADGENHCSFIMRKSCVALIKKTSKTRVDSSYSSSQN